MIIKFSMQTRILVLIIGLVLFISLLLTAVYSYIEYKSTEQEIGEKGLQIANIVAKLPTVRKAFHEEYPEKTIQPIAEEIRELTEAEYVVIGNNNGIRYSHPDPMKLGKKMVGGDNDKALIEGKSYVSKAVGSLGPSMRGKAPILDANGEIIGIVSIGFLMEDIHSIIYSKLMKISGVSLIVLLLGIFGGVFLAKSIRKDTLGLEPFEIASLYRERNAILTSIHEGIIAINKAGRITMMNQSAQQIAGLSKKCTLEKRLDEIYSDIEMEKILRINNNYKNKEIMVNNRHVIVNVTPILEKDKVEGAVLSFRDKTELKEMINTLSEVRKYSEDLRSQTHEYTNKLYVLSGLLQLGNYQEAIELIQTELEITRSQNRILFSQIKDPTVQAILLGKIGKATENKISLIIDSNSYLQKLPNHLSVVKLITIVGNLLDNAMEAVKDSENERKEVIFFATDIGNDIIFEIADNGIGIPDSVVSKIFERGYSTKNTKNRGYGLAIVKEVINELEGQIEIQNKFNIGVVFTVYIPKKVN
ncbi:sensor histidine kinase [Oceanobacillus sp. Castelsardo]|uniref:ATP-binding protein n=1 Tax=Oceanobacillus sp. Castelsardo TaxID=1851204 RepID=UPI000838C52D|nr:sensor histidine kinase [Oceanobacillus sp. Castelsardo]